MMKDKIELTVGQEYLIETYEGLDKVVREVEFIGEGSETIDFKEKDGRCYSLVKTTFANITNLAHTYGFAQDGVNKLLYTIYLKHGKFVAVYGRDYKITANIDLYEDERIELTEGVGTYPNTISLYVGDRCDDEATVKLNKTHARQVVHVLQSFINKPGK